jgi:hypothetical protein
MNNLTIAQINSILAHNGDLEHLMHTGPLYIKEKLAEFDCSEATLLISRRFGKSYFACIYALEKCLTNDNFRVAIVAPSKVQASSIISPIFRDLLARIPKGLAKFGRSTHSVKTHNGSEITIAGADFATENIRGQGFDLVICEEDGSWRKDDYLYIIKNVIRPTVLHSKETLKLLHCSTPSLYLDHPFHTYTLESKPFIKLSIYENPMLTPEMIADECKEQGGEHSFSWRTEYLVEIMKDERLVALPSFDPMRNVYHETVEDEYTIGSFDLGGTRDNTAYVEAVMIEGIIYVTHCHSFPPMTSVKDKADYLKTRKYNKLIADISGQSAIEFNNNEVYFQYPSKTDWETMLIELNTAFHKEELLLSHELVDLVECCNTATLNKQRSDYERSTKFGHYDYIDALKYLWRVRKLFVQNQKKRQKESERELVSYENTSYIIHLKKLKKERELAESFKFKRG